MPTLANSFTSQGKDVIVEMFDFMGKYDMELQGHEQDCVNWSKGRNDKDLSGKDIFINEYVSVETFFTLEISNYIENIIGSVYMINFKWSLLLLNKEIFLLMC